MVEQAKVSAARETDSYGTTALRRGSSASTYAKGGAAVSTLRRHPKSVSEMASLSTVSQSSSLYRSLVGRSSSVDMFRWIGQTGYGKLPVIARPSVPVFYPSIMLTDDRYLRNRLRDLDLVFSEIVRRERRRTPWVSWSVAKSRRIISDLSNSRWARILSIYRISSCRDRQVHFGRHGIDDASSGSETSTVIVRPSLSSSQRQQVSYTLPPPTRRSSLFIFVRFKPLRDSPDSSSRSPRLPHLSLPRRLVQQHRLQYWGVVASRVSGRLSSLWSD